MSTSPPVMTYPSDEHEDAVEFLEFQQELELEFQQELLESESRLLRNQDVDSLLHPMTPISSVLATAISDNSSDENVFHDIEDDEDDDNENHELDVGLELDLDHESPSNTSKELMTKTKHATTPKTVAITEVDDYSARKERRKNRRKDIPKDISIHDAATTTQKDAKTTTTQLLHLDRQIVLEQFGVYSDLSGEEEDEEESLSCLQNAAVVTLSSVQATARMVQECQNATTNHNNNNDDGQNHDASSANGIRDGYCPITMPTIDCCGGGDNHGPSAFENCYGGLQLFGPNNNDDDEQEEEDRDPVCNEEELLTAKEEEEQVIVDTTKPDIATPETVNHEPIDLQVGEPVEDDEEEEGIGTMDDDDEHQFAVNRSFSSFTHQPGTYFCQDNCDVMSQYWERIKLALVNNHSGGDNYYQAIDAKSQASLLSNIFDRAAATHSQPLEQKDSLSYSSMDDDGGGTFASPFFLEKCRNVDDSFSNEMDKMISCALPNGLIFCTIWLDHPDYLEQAYGQNPHLDISACDVVESDFDIRNGCEIVWRLRCNKSLVEFPHAAAATRSTQASDLLRCFSWAGDKDHAVVYQLNQVLAEMRRATNQNCLDEGEQEEDGIEMEAPVETDVSDSSEEDQELEIVLWTSPKRIFPHFVDVHGNHVSTVHLVRETKSTPLGRYACGNHHHQDKISSFGRIVFFVKTFDSIPSLMSAPSDEMDQGEETILEEESGSDDDDNDEDIDEEEEKEEACPHDEEEWLATEEDATCPHDEDTHHNEEWSVAGRSNVTTMVDNRTRPQRVRYVLKDESDEEFSERFGL